MTEITAKINLAPTTISATDHDLLNRITTALERLEWRAAELLDNLNQRFPDWPSALKASRAAGKHPLLIETLEQVVKLNLVKEILCYPKHLAKHRAWVTAQVDTIESPKLTAQDEALRNQIDREYKEYEKERAKAEAIEAHRKRSGLTHHDFSRKTFESLDLEMIDNNVVEKIYNWDYDSNNRGIYLCGPTGVGKTHLLKALCRKQAAEGSNKTCLAANFDEIMAHLRNFNDEGFNYNQRFYSLYKPAQIVFLDDIPSEIHATQYEVKELFKVFEYCGSRGKRLFFTGNYTANELASSIGHRNADRLVEYCEIIELSGESYRQKKLRG